MTLQEAGQILACITAVYPSFTKDRDTKLLLQIWQRVFAAVPFPVVEQAVYTFFATDTKGFPPTPGAVCACITRMREMNEPTEDEIWTMVVRAASRSGYNAAEEFAKLPPDVQRIVGSPQQLHEWSQMDSHEFYSVIGSAVRRSWRARQQAKRELGPMLFRGENMHLYDDQPCADFLPAAGSF